MEKMYKTIKKNFLLTLKINLSHAICNSKNEDKFFSFYLYVKCLFFSTFFAMSHHRTQSNFYLSTTHMCTFNMAGDS